MQANGGVLPANAVLMKGNIVGAAGPGSGDPCWVISRASAVSGGDLRTADAGRDENGRPDVKFDLTGEGGRRFAAFTGSHVGDQLAVVLDNKVMEVATIQEQIHDEGRSRAVHRAAGAGSFADAALGRAAGRHRVPRRAHGWTVAGSCIDRAGVMAALVGMSPSWCSCSDLLPGLGHQCGPGAVPEPRHPSRFHGISGVHADAAGHRGVILTIGMGVDSNVLIFERIREELRLADRHHPP